MKNCLLYVIICLLLTGIACNPPVSGSDPEGNADSLRIHHFPAPWPDSLNREMYHDKILGMLIGSAIGDAMGAPTEMWHRSQITAEWGYVDRLDSLLRIASPEGPWKDDLPPGGTTDDTRWKELLTEWLTESPAHQDSLSSISFAQLILNRYSTYLKMEIVLDSVSGAVRREDSLRRYWLSEWAKVAEPYSVGNLEAYSQGVNKFYGGEMACAGMLYAPMIGAYYPASATHAYREAYRLSFFDLGYARDITGLTSAYVSEAMRPGATVSSILQLSDSVDPQGYAQSRLIGRTAHRIYQTAAFIIAEARQQPTEITARNRVYELLDEHLQDIPFHAAEIHLINLAAILFSDGDFRTAMEFVVNYGRDNDTVAAVTGAILGAYWGAERLPADWSTQVVQVNRDQLGINLEKMATELVAAAYRGAPE